MGSAASKVLHSYSKLLSEFRVSPVNFDGPSSSVTRGTVLKCVRGEIPAPPLEYPVRKFFSALFLPPFRPSPLREFVANNFLDS